MRAAAYGAGAVHSLCVLIICLFTAICLPTFSLRFYSYEYAKNNVYARIGAEESELMAVTERLLGYMRGERENLDGQAVVAGQRREFFNEKEKAHMVDVKNLFSLGFALRNTALAGFALTLLLLRALGCDPWSAAAAANRVVIPACLALMLVLCALAARNFDAAFTAFHEIFFTNDLWILDPDTDLLLNMVPLPFFVDIAAVVAALFVVMAALVTGASFWYGKRSVKKKESRA